MLDSIRGAVTFAFRVFLLALLAAAIMSGCSADPKAAPTEAAGSATVFSLADGTRAGFAQTSGLASSRDGKHLYFTARRIADDAPAVYELDVTTNQVSQLYGGAPLLEPGSIAVSADGRSLLIVDLAAGTGDLAGTVFKMPITGSLAPAPILPENTIDLPGGITVDRGGRVFVTGFSPAGDPALFAMTDQGAPVTIIAQGDPFREPTALTVTHDQHSVVLLDTDAEVDGTSALFRVNLKNGEVGALAHGLPTRFPSGVASDPGSSEFFISGLNAQGKPAILGVATDGTVRTVVTPDAAAQPAALVQSPVSPYVLYLADADGTGGTGNILTIFR